jgi:hypothetical protein
MGVENRMLHTLSSTSLLTIMEILGAIVVAAAMIYAIIEWSRRRRTKAEVSAAATRGVNPDAPRQDRAEERIAPPRAATMQAADDLPTNPKLRGALRSGREEGRFTEDEIAREHVDMAGRGASKPKVLDERETQINKHLDPGHTA